MRQLKTVLSIIMLLLAAACVHGDPFDIEMCVMNPADGNANVKAHSWRVCTAPTVTTKVRKP